MKGARGRGGRLRLAKGWMGAMRSLQRVCLLLKAEAEASFSGGLPTVTRFPTPLASLKMAAIPGNPILNVEQEGQ